MSVLFKRPFSLIFLDTDRTCRSPIKVDPSPLPLIKMRPSLFLRGLFIKWPTTTSNLGDCQTIVLSDRSIVNTIVLIIIEDSIEKRDTSSIWVEARVFEFIEEISREKRWMFKRSLPIFGHSLLHLARIERSCQKCISNKEQRTCRSEIFIKSLIKILPLFSSNVEKRGISNLFFFT